MWPASNGLGPWRHAARCQDFDTDVFFPTPGESNRPAKAICGDCPVVCDCLEYALARPHILGVWGGRSEREREWIRRGRKAS